MMRAFGVCQDYQRCVLLRRICSNRQVLEMMTEFWENHLNVPRQRRRRSPYRRAYGDDDPRQRARAASRTCCSPPITHPAMLDLPRQRQLHRRAPQREPRPRAARAAHRRARQLHRGRRQGVRPDPHRLRGRHVGTSDLGRVVQPRRPLAAARCTVMGFPDAERRRRRPRPRPGATSATSRTTRPTARRIARKLAREVRPRRRRRPRWWTTWPRSTSTTTPRSCPVLRALVASREFAALRGRQGPRPRRGPWSRTWRVLGRPVRPAHRPDEAAANPLLWQAGSLGTDAVHVAATRRRSRSTTSRGASPSRLMASMRHAPLDERRLVADAAQGIAYRKPGLVAARRCPMRFDELVDHLASSCCTGARRPAAEGLLPTPSATTPTRRSPATRPRAVGHAAGC